MISNSIQPQNETVPHGIDRVPPSLRRFGAGLVEQASLRAKFAAAVAVAGGAFATSAPAMAEDAKSPSASDSLFIVTDRLKPLGVQVTPETDLTKHIDITVECGADCQLELRCPGGKIDGIIFQERIEDGGISVIVDKSRGRAGLATCPGDKKPFPFVVPEYMALPPLSPIPPPEDAASQPDEAIPLPVASSAQVEAPEPAAVAIAVVEESSAAKSEPTSQFALNAGVEVPLTSTHDFMREPGVFVEATGHPFESLAGARGVLRAAWNPIAEQSAGDDARFHPRNSSQRLYGNAVRATGGLVYPHEFARSGGFSLDAEGGVDAGLAVLSVPRRKDAGVDKDGYLADIPGSDTITAVIEGHGGLAANFGKRLRVALGLRHGQSPFAVQTKAGARAKAHANFTSVNAGLGVQF